MSSESSKLILHPLPNVKTVPSVSTRSEFFQQLNTTLERAIHILIQTKLHSKDVAEVWSQIDSRISESQMSLALGSETVQDFSRYAKHNLSFLQSIQ